MSNITVNVDIDGGTDIKDACYEAVELANKLNVVVKFKFNSVICLAIPSGNPENLINSWASELDSKKQIKIATTLSK